MPTSPYAHLYCFVEYLNVLRPDSILDIGLGNGKLGFMARDLLDVMLGERYKKCDWQLRLDGIEVFADYVQDHQKAIYDQIHIGDAYDVIDGLDTYDMVVLGDVLEHFPKDKAWMMLDKCFAHARRGAILFVPLGENWNQPAIYGNPHETHRSSWTLTELAPMSSEHELYRYSAGPYGAFLIPKEKYLEHRIETLKSAPYFPTQPGAGTDLRSRYQLNRESIGAIDLTALSRHTANDEYRSYFLDDKFREHYRLIAHLSRQFNDSVLFDVGTLKGYSALAMSFNGTNRIVSYDLSDFKELAHPEELNTIEYCIGNVLTDERLLSAPLILLDTNHDGSFEDEFYAHLCKHNYKGLLMLDDISLNDAMMRFWEGIDRPKEDVTDLGHWSGTGLVYFGS